MTDRDPRTPAGDYSSDSSDRYRPFDDPTHPSWYSDASAPPATPGPTTAGQSAAERNPYADQPLAGPYTNGQPQYPIHGQYPVIANQPGGQHPSGYGTGAGQDGRQAGHPYPGAGSYPYSPGGRDRPSTGLGVTSMVLGIVGVATGGFLFIPQILAIIFGHLSLSKEPAGRGFAIAGLVMGYLGLIVVLFVLFGLFAFIIGY
ncbi:DUF4190 domain-containing protein [Citricoccus sp. GCM10030269]|uniref:DUF4190 domain-containing protein n=1 Tax=Citricoccus sp. GCM10030269 TaxID=3273388 RepID=UPI0036067CBE